MYAVILLLPVSACVCDLYAAQETSLNGIQLFIYLVLTTQERRTETDFAERKPSSILMSSYWIIPSN